MRAPVPVRPSVVELVDCDSRERLHLAQYRGDAFAGELAIPLDLFSPAHAVFIKLERRLWFFDEAGWLETPPVIADSLPTRMTRMGSPTPEVLS